MGYSLKSYFGGKDTEAYRRYKEGQKAGKWTDLPSYLASGGTSSMAPGQLAKKQAKTEADFLNRYKSAVKSQPSMSDIYTRLSEEAGLPALRETSYRLGQTLKDIPEQEKIFAKQVGISQPRLAKRIAGRQADISPSYMRAVEAQQFAERDVGERLGLAASELDRALKPYDVEAAMISDRLSRELTGYTAQLQSETSRLLAKLQQRGALDQIEAKRLVDLATLEQETENWKKKLKYEYELKQKYGASETPESASPIDIASAMDNVLSTLGGQSASVPTNSFPFGGSITAPYSPMNPSDIIGYGQYK